MEAHSISGELGLSKLTKPREATQRYKVSLEVESEKLPRVVIGHLEGLAHSGSKDPISLVLVAGKVNLDLGNSYSVNSPKEFVSKSSDVEELLLAIKQLVHEKIKDINRHQSIYKPPSDGIQSADEKFIGKIISIIESNLGDSSFSVEQLAIEAATSKARLYRKVKSITKLNPVNFILHIRLENAMAMLQKRAGNVSEIAYAVGFNNLSYFTKCFKKKYKKTPFELIYPSRL